MGACFLSDPYLCISALEGGAIPPALSLFQCIIAVLCVAFFVCLVPNCIVRLVIGTCLSSCGQFVCLPDSFRYNGLATLALVAFDRMQALRGGQGGSFPPLLRQGGCLGKTSKNLGAPRVQCILVFRKVVGVIPRSWLTVTPAIFCSDSQALFLKVRFL